MRDRPMKWQTWLPMVEWCYNTNYYLYIWAIPFEDFYGYKPPYLTMNEQCTSADQMSYLFVKERLQVVTIFKQNLIDAQALMKFYANKKVAE